MKKKIYIFLVMFLFLLLGILLFSGIEFLGIKLYIFDSDKYSLGLSWNTLISIRNFSAILFLSLSVWLGYFVGKIWWKYIYIDKKHKRFHNMKKTFLFTALFFALFLVTACSNNTNTNDVLMDELASDNKYHYTNEDLSFSLNLPEQFIYYQTQRNDNALYKSVEYFIPTNDLNYPQSVPSYANFLNVRVFDKSDYEKDEDSVYFGEKDDKAYAGYFWQKIPTDWKDKWNEDTKNEIIKSFKIN